MVRTSSLKNLVERRSVRILLFCGLLVIGWGQLKISFFAQSDFRGGRARAVRLSRGQFRPAHLTRSAKNAWLLHGDGEKAERLLQRALAGNPLYVPAWIALGELQNNLGKTDQALAILDYLDRLMREVGPWHWQKTMLAYQLGEREMVARDLNYIIANLPDQRNKAIALAFSLWDDPEKLKAEAGSGEGNLFRLFSAALRPDRLKYAVAWWPEVRRDPELTLKQKLRYIELLRQDADNGRGIGPARSVWREEIDADHLLHNGDFASPPLGTAFGWRVGRLAAVSWKLTAPPASRRTAFHLHFEGGENVNYHHLYQYLPLEPGRYVLTGKAKTAGLTTDQRPFIEVYGYRVKKPREAAAMFAADQPWQDFRLEFEVPEECRQVLVRLRRKPSYYINSRISGDLWLSGLKVEPAAEVGDRENRE